MSEQPSLRLTTPLVLVISSAPTGLVGNCGKDGGASTGLPPNVASEQLILANNCDPVSGPDWPSRGTEFLALAAALQALRWSSVKVRHRAATLPKARRTPIWGAVCGLAGMPRIRLTRPYRLLIETYRPLLPDCGMSSIFICYLLTFFCCLFVEMARVAPSGEAVAGETARAKRVWPGAPAF